MTCKAMDGIKVPGKQSSSTLFDFRDGDFERYAWLRQLMCVVPDMDDIEPKIL
jgi:hypothetical protein